MASRTRGLHGSKLAKIGKPKWRGGRSNPNYRKDQNETKRAEKIQRAIEHLAEENQKRFGPDINLLSKNFETFLTQTKCLDYLETAFQEDNHTRALAYIVDFKVERVFMCVVEIARRIRLEDLEKIEWSPEELGNIVFSPVNEIQSYMKGDENDGVVCLDPHDANFLRGSNEQNETAIRTWNSLLAWSPNKAVSAPYKCAKCACSDEKRLRVELEMEKDMPRNCNHPNRVESFRLKVRNILIEHLNKEAQGGLLPPRYVTRTRKQEIEAAADHAAEMQLWYEEAERAVAEELPSNVTVEAAMTGPTEDQPPSISDRLSAGEITSLNTMNISTLDRHNDAHLILHTNRPNHTEEPHLAATLMARHNVEDPYTFFEKEMQTRMADLQTKMTTKMTSWMRDEERKYTLEVRAWCADSIQQATKSQFQANSEIMRRLSVIENFKTDNQTELLATIKALGDNVRSLMADRPSLKSAFADLYQIRDETASFLTQHDANLQQLGENIEKLNTDILRLTQAEVKQQQSCEAVAARTLQKAIEETKSTINSLHGTLQSDLMNAKNEVAEVIDSIRHTDLRRYNITKFTTAIIREKINAQIQNLKLAAKNKEDELEERLKNGENKNDEFTEIIQQLETGLEELKSSMKTQLLTKSGVLSGGSGEFDAYVGKNKEIVTADLHTGIDIMKKEMENTMKLRAEEMGKAIETRLYEFNQILQGEVCTKMLQATNRIALLETNKASSSITSELQHQMNGLQPLWKLTQDLAMNAAELGAKFEGQNEHILRIESQSETYKIETKSRVEHLEAMAKSLGASMMTRLVSAEKANQAIRKTVDAHSTRNRLEEELIALQNSEAEQPKLLAREEWPAKESAKVESFIKEAQTSLDDTNAKGQLPLIITQDELQGLGEKLNEISDAIQDLENFKHETVLKSINTESRLNNLESRTSTFEQSLQSDNTLKIPRLQALADEMKKTNSCVRQLEETFKASTSDSDKDNEFLQLQQEQNNLAKGLTDLRATLTKKVTLQPMQDTLEKELEDVRRDVEELKQNTKAQEVEMQTMQNNPKCAEPPVTQWLQSQATAFEKLPEQVQCQIIPTPCRIVEIENNTENPVSAANELQVQHNKLTMLRNTILNKQILEFYNERGVLHLLKLNPAELEQVEQSTSNPYDQEKTLEATVEAQNDKNQLQASSDIGDEPPNSGSRAVQRPKSEWEAGGRKSLQERSLYENENTLQGPSDSVNYCQNRFDKLIGKEAEAEDATHIDKITTEIRSEWATVKQDLQSQLDATVKSLRILEDCTKSLKTKKEDSEGTSNEADNQSSCHCRKSKTESCHQVKSGITKTQDSVENGCFELPDGTAWLFQQLKAKDIEIARIIDYYDNQRSKHFTKCKTYAERKRAQTLLLETQIKQLQKNLDTATDEIQRRDKYIATISEAKEARHGNGGLGWNGDGQEEKDTKPTLTRETVNRRSQPEKPCSADNIVKTGPRMDANTDASVANRVRSNKRDIEGTKKKPRTYNLRNKTKASLVPNSPSTSQYTSPQKMVQPYRLAPLENIPAFDVNVDYLQPGFDPKFLTVPQLRCIFVRHEIKYASNSNKKDLIDLYRSEIEPRASVTLEQRAKVEPSVEGIIDVTP